MVRDGLDGCLKGRSEDIVLCWTRLVLSEFVRQKMWEGAGIGLTWFCQDGYLTEWRYISRKGWRQTRNYQEERKELWESKEQKREMRLPLSKVLFVTDIQQLREFPNNPQKLGSESTILDYGSETTVSQI